MKTVSHHEATLKPFKTAISFNAIIACFCGNAASNNVKFDTAPSKICWSFFQYFLRRLSSQQTRQRLQAIRGLRLVLSPMTEDGSGPEFLDKNNEWLLVNIYLLINCLTNPAVVAWFVKAPVHIQLNKCLGRRWIESHLSMVYQLFRSGNTLSQFQLQNAGSLREFMIHALDVSW